MMTRQEMEGMSVSAMIVVAIGGMEYLLDRKHSTSIPLPLDGDIGEPGTDLEERRYIPATVVDANELAAATRGWYSTKDDLRNDNVRGGRNVSIKDQTLATLVNTYREVGDDVWTEDFLEVIITSGGEWSSSDRLPRSDTNATGWIIHLADEGGNANIKPGPCVIDRDTGKVYPVSRLFLDTNDCFVRGALYDDDAARFHGLSGTDRIPVPSRLAFPDPTPEKPLSGLRFGVKDVIDITGLETGCGSADYKAFYPPRTTTAACIQRLLDAGAVMVGKMRTCMWCDGQDPLERFEEPTPMNPRGDRFQKPSGSSCGSAAGCAAYAWLDLTIGTDTGGSIRHPAAVNGIYGMRPSLGSTGPTSGLVCSELTDTVGVFARSSRVARDVMNVMFDRGSGQGGGIADAGEMDGEDGNRKQKPAFRLLYATTSPPTSAALRSTTPQFFPPSSAPGPESQTEAGRTFEEFVVKLERALKCRHEEICIADRWSLTHPERSPDDLVEMMEGVYQDVVYRDLAKGTVTPFIKDFRNQEGRKPFIEPSTRKRLEYGSRVSDEDYSTAVTKLKTFGAWVNNVLLPPPLKTSNLSTTAADNERTIPLLIYPQTWGTPRYRNEVVKRDGLFWTGFSLYSLSYASGCPDFTLPIGEASYHSKITEREELLPLTISLLGPKGCDGVMLDLIAELEGRGVLKGVKPGCRLF